MGHLRHECMVVSGWNEKHVAKAREIAIPIFQTYDMEELVGEIVPHKMNGGAAFLIAPDGSKEGWAQSEEGAAARQEYMAFLKGQHDLGLEWCLLLIGGDDGEYRVLNSPNGAQISA